MSMFQRPNFGGRVRGSICTSELMVANSGKFSAKRSKWLTLSLGVHSTEVARGNIGRFVKTLRIDRAPLEGTSGGSGAAHRSYETRHLRPGVHRDFYVLEDDGNCQLAEEERVFTRVSISAKGLLTAASWQGGWGSVETRLKLEPCGNPVPYWSHSSWWQPRERRRELLFAIEKPKRQSALWIMRNTLPYPEHSSLSLETLLCRLYADHCMLNTVEKTLRKLMRGSLLPRQSGFKAGKSTVDWDWEVPECTRELSRFSRLMTT